VTPLAVLDSSVAIDLHRGELLSALFALPHKFMVSEIMFRDELQHWFGDALVTGGIELRDLDGPEVECAQEFLRRCPALSLHDAYALAQAAVGGHTLLAGAKDMRELGIECGVEVRGVLHVFDLIEEVGLLAPASLHTCLTLVCRSTRTRLPREEVQLRFNRYSAAAGWPARIPTGDV
jgi:hypothetical protein